MTERLLVIGGDAGGMAAASQARRLRPDLDIVALERGRHTSYSACGIPYLIGGEVDDVEQLVSRRPQEFRDRFRIDVRMRSEAMGIDLDARQVEVRDHARERTYTLGFDQLMLGMGSRPRRPDLPGIKGPNIFGVQTLDDAEVLLEHAERSACKEVAVIGAGYIGLEMAEAFTRRGAEVTVIERDPEVMRTLDPEIGARVRAAIEGEGIDVRVGTSVEGFEPGAVLTSGGKVAADLVLLALGVQPNSELAAEAGIAIGAGRAVAVDRRQETEVAGVWAAGDCCETYNLVSGRKVYVALGTVTNKASRVAGTNIGGGYATFDGVVGTAITKVCDVEVARTGLTEAEANRDAFRYHVATVESTTTAGYHPRSNDMTVKVLAEARTGRLLGAQIFGGQGSAKRIDVFATALHAAMDVEVMTSLDLAYAPPFAPVWDPVLIAARKAAEAVASGTDVRGAGISER